MGRARRRRHVVVATALVAAIGLAAPARAITDGTPDGTRHPSVGALVYPGTALPVCSGTLVPSVAYGAVFLTAAHCLTDLRGRSMYGARVRVTFDPTVTATSTFYAGRYYGDPAFEPNGRDPQDLAVVVFRKPPPVAPVPLAPIGSAGAAVRGTSFTTVGYGLPRLGTRQRATERTYASDSVWLYLAPAPGGPACDMDSGGPDLLAIGGTTYVAATTNRGDDQCQQYDQSYRVDTEVAAAYVDARH